MSNLEHTRETWVLLNQYLQDLYQQLAQECETGYGSDRTWDVVNAAEIAENNAWLVFRAMVDAKDMPNVI